MDCLFLSHDKAANRAVARKILSRKKHLKTRVAQARRRHLIMPDLNTREEKIERDEISISYPIFR